MANSDTSSDNSSSTIEMSEDIDQLLIESLTNEVKMLKQCIRLLMEKDKEKSQRIRDLQSIIMTRKGNDCTGTILDFL